MKQFRLIPFALMAMGLAFPAYAADMPMKGPPVAVAASDWNGVLLGVGFGSRSVTNDWTTNCLDAAPVGLPTGTGCPNGRFGPGLFLFPGFPDSPTQASFKNSGFRPSVYVGGQFEVYNTWVFGAEIEAGFGNKQSTIVGIPGCVTAACNGGIPSSTAGDSIRIVNGQDLSFRPRVGYLLFPSLLLYATGGPSLQKIEATVACNGLTSPLCFNPIPGQTTQSQWLLGYTVGGGLEWKVWDHWLLRGEYRFSDYGTWKPGPFLGINAGFVGNPNVFGQVSVTSQMWQFGLAYLFKP